VAPCRSCVDRRFGGTYRLHLQGRKICERGTSMSRWLHTESPVENTQLYKNRVRREGEWVTWEISREERGRVCRDGRAGSRERARAGIGSMSACESQCYPANIDPVASGLSCRNVGSHKIYTAPHPRRRHSSQSPLWKPQNPTKIESDRKRKEDWPGLISVICSHCTSGACIK
jgi:hypothetical protein